MNIYGCPTKAGGPGLISFMTDIGGVKAGPMLDMLPSHQGWSGGSSSLPRLPPRSPMATPAGSKPCHRN